MPDPRIDVTGLPPLAQHAIALQVLDDRTGLPTAGGWQGGRDLEGLTGRRAILERHAPDPDDRRFCIDALTRATVGDMYWPCQDYIDAAAGLVTGLEAVTDE